MSDPFLGQISVFGFNFAPYGWAQCAGQLVPISQNSALFSLLGTYYGGNGTTNFALPNMQGNVAVGQGAAPGLQPYVMGETGGEAAVALTGSEGPMHGHSLMTNVVDSTSNTATGNVLAVPDGPGSPRPAAGNIYNPNPPNVVLTSITGPAGNSQPHANMQPSLALNYCICINGVFPPRG
jgi:microcystin-dependent protein